MKKITILLFAIAAIGSGCKKFTDINQNPNQPLAVTPNVVLSAALTGSANNLATDFLLNTRWMGNLARSGNYIADAQTEGYGINTGYADGDFQNLFNTLSRYNYIEQQGDAAKASSSFYIGVAKTMKALHFSTLVDGFGNIPYKQAFNVNKYPTPAYDDAKSIYEDLVLQLDSAVTLFDATKTYYALSTTSASVLTTDDKYDIIFGRGLGTSSTTRLDKWVMFANTLKMKLLLHLSGVSSEAGLITSEVAKINANGRGFLPAGLSAAVNPGYSSSGSQFNPFYALWFTPANQPSTNNNFYRANNYALNFYNSSGDQTRQFLVYAPVGNAVVGNYDGDPQSLTNTFTSGIGSGVVKGPTQDQLILSDFESLFIQAEAVQKGYIEGNAATLLQQAIEQNYIYLGDSAGDADDYYTGGAGNPNVDYATGGLQAIITQKWIALNCINWFETYTEFRRTGFPNAAVLGLSHAVTHVTAPDGKVHIPFRYLYPQSEINSNGKNVPALAKAQYTPIFWDTLDQ